MRKDDSFVSFEEVFELAAAHRADMVLLGGDLFHDNKPSRQTGVCMRACGVGGGGARWAGRGMRAAWVACFRSTAHLLL